MKMHRFWFHTHNRRSSGVRLNFYLILWIMILCGTIYLLIRLAAQSFSEEMGHPKLKFGDAIMYYISNKAIESGSALVEYTASELELEAPFPYSLVSDKLAILGYVDEKGSLMAKASQYRPQDYSTNLTPSSNQPDSISTNTKETMGNSSAPYQETENVDSFRLRNGIGINKLSGEGLSKEYILTNGSIYNTTMAAFLASVSGGSEDGKILVGSLNGEVDIIEKEGSSSTHEAVTVSNPGNVIDYTMEQLKDISFLIRHFYIVDPDTRVTESLFDAEKLLGKDMTLKQTGDAPQILIYHTHSQESYIDSKPGVVEDTVVGVGNLLTQILTEQYGYNVIHDTTKYDIIDGKLDRNNAYNVARVGIGKILEQNPTIEVIIDLHRDGAGKRATLVDGKETAQIMLFNGLSRDQTEPLTYLDNPVLQDNLAFSLQLQLKGVKLYPGLFYKNYLKAYRYNLHLRPKSLLVELGTDKNTLESAKNAMEPFAEVLNSVLQGETP